MHKIDPYTGEVIERHVDYYEGLEHIAKHGWGYYKNSKPIINTEQEDRFALDRLADDGCPRGEDMGPDYDARAGQFASEREYTPVLHENENDGDFEGHWLTLSEILHNEEEHQKRVAMNTSSGDWWKAHGIEAKVGSLLDQYLTELKEVMVNDFENFLKMKMEAIDEAKAMCENPDKPMWNHVPSTAEQRKQRRKALKIERHQRNLEKRPMSGPHSYQTYASVADEKDIATALHKAIRHAERVAKRDHIKADRIERVNLFMTSLRREFGYVGSKNTNVGSLAGDLTKKELWHDIGMLALTWPTYGMRHSRAEVQKWLDAAKKMKDSTDSARYEIEGDLEELERMMTGAFSTIEDARKINEEGEVVANQLCRLFE